MTLIIENLSKQKDENWAFRDVFLEVKRGEVLGIFGNSEQDKYSLLKVVAGLENQDSGKIIFDGEDISKLNYDKRGFEFPHESESSLLSSIFKPNQNAAKFESEKALILDKPLQNAKSVLLLNNPFWQMDRQQREEKTDLLRKTINEKNLAVLFSSNNYEEIFSLCDQVAILNNGQIIQTGTPREVYEKPKTVAVAKITGRNNLITARRITSTKKETPEFQTIEGEHRLYTDKVEKTDLGAINQNIKLAIRPEHISISFGASFPADNLLKAEITEIKYLGATTLIKLNANGLTLEALVLRLVGLNVGDECVVGLPPDRILVLKD